MAILANPDYFERAQEGHIDQVLVAVRYTGPSRWYGNNSASTEGLWPTRQNWLQDEWHVGFVPEGTPAGVSGDGVGWFERNEHFEVAYDRETVAEVILTNGAELIPGGPIGEGDALPGFDARVRETLGLEPVAEAGKSELEQVRALAGVDDAGDDAAGDPVDVFVEEYGYDDLKDRVKDVREDADEFSLQGTSMREMAEWLVEHGVDPGPTQEA